MKKTLLLLFFFTFYMVANGQINLVKNGDFEKKDTCPYLTDQIKIAKYWSGIDTNYFSTSNKYFGNPNCTPEYVNTCNVAPAGAPISGWFGYQYPRSGNGMVNMYMYHNDTIVGSPALDDYKRDYLLGRLSKKLTAGQTYCVTFYVVMSNKASYAVNNIGAYLDNGSIDTNSHCGWVHTQYTPQVMESSVISDTLNWVKIQGSFVANGTEKYITIGQFSDTAHTSKIRRSNGPRSHYEVDDVSVIATGSAADAGPDKHVNIGNSASIGVDSNGGGMPCYWYVLGNTSPIDSGGTIKVSPTDTATYVVVMDLCGVVTTDTMKVFTHPAGMNDLQFKNVNVYPNPANDHITIENAEGTTVSVFDILGHEVLNASINSGTQTVNISTLSKGVYVLQLTEPLTGYRVSRKIVKE